MSLPTIFPPRVLRALILLTTTGCASGFVPDLRVGVVALRRDGASRDRDLAIHASLVADPSRARRSRPAPIEPSALGPPLPSRPSARCAVAWTCAWERAEVIRSVARLTREAP